MGTTLSSLRVAASFDATDYVSGMQAKINADQAGAQSSSALAASMDAANSKANDSGAAFARLSAQYVPGARAAQQFQQAVLNLGNQIDRGNISAAQVPGLLQAIYAKYGYVADAATLTSRGYTTLGSAAEDLNTRFAKQISSAGAAGASFDLVAGKLATMKNSGLDPVSAAMEGMNRMMLATSANLGPVGTMLAAMGPEGLAVAFSVGAAAAAFESLVAGASDLAQRATALQSFAQATGLSTDEIQGLTESGSQFGITSQTVTEYVERLSSSLGQAQQGTGALFDALLKINPALALQISGVKSAQQGLDLLAQAYKSAADAGNITLASQIARAAGGGRNGDSVGPLLDAVANAGGVLNIGQEAQSSGNAISSTLIPQLVALNSELNEAKLASTNIFESMFSEQVLSAELEFFQGLEKIGAKLAEIQQNSSPAATGAKAIGLGLLSAIPGIGPGVSLIASQFANKPSATAASPTDYDLAVSVAGLAGLGTAQSAATGSAAGLLKIQQQLVSAFQGTATPAQDLTVKILALKAALDGHQLSAEQAAHAQGLLVESFNVTQMQSNISAMGALATPTQQYDLAVAKLTLDLNQGKISQYAFNAGVMNAQQTLASSTEALKEQYGLASDADIAAVAYQKYNNAMAAIGATAEQSAAGLPALNKQVQQLIDSAHVGASTLPQFTQLLQNLKNPNTTTDELLTSSANAILQAGQGFTQALQQGDTIAQAIAAALTSAANSVANAFATAGAKSIAGSFLGTNTATAGSGGMAGAISSALGLGAGSLVGGLATGGISMAIGAGISMITGSISQSQQAQQAWQQAQANWAGMADEIAEFVCAMMTDESGRHATAPDSAVEKPVGKESTGAEIINLAGRRKRYECHQLRAA